MKRAALMLAVLALQAACKREDMYTQRVVRQWDPDLSAPDQTSVRPPVAGTLAREQPDAPVPAPVIIDAALLQRGQARYDIFCSPCHAVSGDGEGMIVQRGFPHPPAFTADRLRHARAQVFYDAITNGHGAMYSYAARVPPADRWAIAAYIRALQLSQSAVIAALPPQDRARLADADMPQPAP
jgi:mono/diheme cytochrome c family protein